MPSRGGGGGSSGRGRGSGGRGGGGRSSRGRGSQGKPRRGRRIAGEAEILARNAELEKKQREIDAEDDGEEESGEEEEEEDEDDSGDEDDSSDDEQDDEEKKELRRGNRKKQDGSKRSAGGGGDDEKSWSPELEVQNPNRGGTKSIEQTGIEMNRRLREQLDKEDYDRKRDMLEREGKTHKAKADLKRLEEVRRRREEAKKIRDNQDAKNVVKK